MKTVLPDLDLETSSGLEAEFQESRCFRTESEDALSIWPKCLSPSRAGYERLNRSSRALDGGFGVEARNESRFAYKCVGAFGVALILGGVVCLTTLQWDWDALPGSHSSTDSDSIQRRVLALVRPAATTTTLTYSTTTSTSATSTSVPKPTETTTTSLRPRQRQQGRDSANEEESLLLGDISRGVDDEEKTSTPAAAVQYECHVGYFNWQEAWSSNKAAWCCLHHRRGCPRTEIETTTRRTALTSLPSMSIASTAQSLTAKITFTTPTTTTVVPAATVRGTRPIAAATNLIAALAAVVRMPFSAAVVATALPQASTRYDCDVNATLGEPWTDGKKAWCCKNYGLKCATVSEALLDVQDCTTGVSHWQVGWSVFKKDWCCRHARVGCHLPTAIREWNQENS